MLFLKSDQKFLVRNFWVEENEPKPKKDPKAEAAKVLAETNFFAKVIFIYFNS